jgi:protein SEY1
MFGLLTNNEIVIRNPFLFLLLIMLAGGLYVAYTLNLLGPMMQMANAATNQGVEIGKQKLREFLENSDTARQALAMPAKDSDSISLDTLDSLGKKKTRMEEDEDI